MWFNTDGALENTYAALRNSNTGIGTSRDKTQLSSVNLYAYTLSEAERVALFRQSKIAQKAILTYPLDAARGWVDFTFGQSKIKPQDLHNYFNNLKTGNLRTAFKEASIEGRWHGDGWLLLGIDDGQDWDQPVNENNIKSFRWVENLYWNEVTPDFTYSTRRPQHYFVSTGLSGGIPDNNGERTGISFVRVHRSRILRFPGDSLHGSAINYNAGRNDSILQSMFDAFSQFFMGLGSSSAMLADYSVFIYKLNGLAKLIQQGKQDELMQRFLTIQMGMSTMKGLAMDAEKEDGSFVQRSYSGVKDILEQLLEQLVASTDMPRYKLLGSSSKEGLGSANKGEAERYDWASRVNSWQVDNWDDALRYCVRLALLAKDGITRGKLPDDYGIIWKNTLQLTPLEEAELRLKKAQEAKIHVEIASLAPYEVRMSAFGGAAYSPEITLDPRVTKVMEDAINTPTEPKQEEPTEETEQKTDSSDLVIASGTVLEDSEFEALSKIEDGDIEETVREILG